MISINPVGMQRLWKMFCLRCDGGVTATTTIATEAATPAAVADGAAATTTTSTGSSKWRAARRIHSHMLALFA